MSGRSRPLYCCTLRLIAMQGHKTNKNKRHDEPGLHFVNLGLGSDGCRGRKSRSRWDVEMMMENFSIHTPTVHTYNK